MGPLRREGLAVPLVALTLAHLGLLLIWSLVVPTFRGADEHVHHDLLRHLTDTWSYPEYDGLDVSRRTLDALGTSPAFPADAGAVPADAAQDRSQRPGWAELGPDVRNGPPNQMPQHPPLYYESAAAVLRLLDGDGTAPLDRAVWQLRLLNVLLMAPLPLIAADVARRFTRAAPLVLASAAGVLAVPQLTHIGATVSNDPLMIVLGSLTLAGAARLVTGDRRWGVAAATGVAAGLAMFTKGFGVPLVPAVALACLLPLAAVRRRARENGDDGDDSDGSDGSGARDDGDDSGAWRTSGSAGEPATNSMQICTGSVAGSPDSSRATVACVLGRAALVAGLALAFGGWWWIRNVVAYGTPQPGVRLRDRVPDVELDVVRFAGDFSDRLVTSFWGHFGWFEVQLPVAASVAMTVLVVVAAAAACWRRWPRVVLLLPTLAAGAMVLSAAWGAFKKTGVSYATQGRYLFTGIVGLSVLVALGIARLLRRRSRWQPLATICVALGLQGAALWVSLHRYWAGDSVEQRLRAMVAFAPIPGVATVAVVAAGAACCLAAPLVLGRLRRPDAA